MRDYIAVSSFFKEALASIATHIPAVPRSILFGLNSLEQALKAYCANIYTVLLAMNHGP